MADHFRSLIFTQAAIIVALAWTAWCSPRTAAGAEEVGSGTYSPASVSAGNATSTRRRAAEENRLFAERRPAATADTADTAANAHSDRSVSTTFRLLNDAPSPAATGVSPYADWEEQGMRTPVDPREAREDVTESQRRQINAAYGGADYRGWEHCVAGHPTYLRRHPHPSDTGRYFGYQVGGGTVLSGTGRDLEEGTFGWDYANPLFPARVALGWSHRRVQGGTGAYATDHKKRGE